MDVAATGGARRKMLGPKRTRAVLLALFLAVSIVSPPALLPALAQSFSFSNVEVEGNERVDVATILGFAGIARGQELTAAQLNDAVQRIQNSGLFELVDAEPRGGTLIIRVKEFPTINVVNFEGNARLKDEALAEITGSKSRRVYSPSQAEQDAQIIADAYQEAGRFAATVEPRIIRRDGNRVDLVFEIVEGRVTEVERIAFVGNRAYSDRRLRQVLETKQAGLLRTFIQRDTFVADRVEFDKQLLRDFYLSRGYIDVQILDGGGEMTRERDGFFVTFTVREGQQWTIGNVTTVSEVEGVDAAEFERQVRLRSGVTYSPTIIETNVARLENVALRDGLNFVRVDPRITRNERTRTLDIEFAVVRGDRIFVERIDIEGNTTTLDKVVRRQFRAVEGDPFNPREIRRAAERIRALGYFSTADVDAQQGSGPDQVVVNVNVEEQPTGSLGFGVSYGVSQGVGLNVNFSESNFLGRGQGISLDISTIQNERNFRFGFVEPAFLDRDLRFGVELFYAETNQSNARYNTQNIGFRPSISFPVGENSRLELRYRISRDDLSDLAAGSSAILAAEVTQGALVTSSLGYTLSYDTRRSGLNPNGGLLLRFGQDFAGLGGDLSYISTNVLALTERRVLNEEVTLRAVFEAGAISMIDGNSRVTERFFGNGKVRGFEPNGYGPRDLVSTNEDALGGNYFAAARVEAEFPVGLPEEYGIRGGVFFDVGSVWGLDNTAGGLTGTDPVDDSLRLRSSIGISVFWDTPIGPLRFNLSRPVQKEDYDLEQNFDLTISTSF
jgi:outer membrane protein insertion porin family